MIPGVEHRLGSDSCYSKSDNSSTDSDSARRHKFVQKQEFIEKLHREQEEVARLERLCPRVRQPLVTCPRQKHVYTDTTSLSSVDTNSSSDLWNVRAMPDVTVTRLPDKPISLRANPAVRQRPSQFDTLTDELLIRFGMKELLLRQDLVIE